MYLQTRKEAKANNNKPDAEKAVKTQKTEEPSLLADVILTTVPKEAQIGAPIGSPLLNGYRRNTRKENGVINTGDKDTEKGVTNQAFEIEKDEKKDNNTDNVDQQNRNGIINPGFKEEQ